MVIKATENWRAEKYLVYDSEGSFQINADTHPRLYIDMQIGDKQVPCL